DEALCDWDDLRELERWSVSVQSHGAAHRRLSELDRAEQEAEFLQSRRALEVGLGKLVEMFSYPYGDGGLDPRWSAVALQQAGDGHRGAAPAGADWPGPPGSLADEDPHRQRARQPPLAGTVDPVASFPAPGERTGYRGVRHPGWHCLVAGRSPRWTRRQLLQ